MNIQVQGANCDEDSHVEQLQLLLNDMETKIVEQKEDVSHLQASLTGAKEESKRLQHQVELQSSLLSSKDKELKRELEWQRGKVDGEKNTVILEEDNGDVAAAARFNLDQLTPSKTYPGEERLVGVSSAADISSLKEPLQGTADSDKKGNLMVVRKLLEERNTAVEEVEHLKEDVTALIAARSVLPPHPLPLLWWT